MSGISIRFILPKRIYIKDRDGRYLTERSGTENATLTFRPGDPDLDCVFETNETGLSWYKFLARTGNAIMRYYHDPGWYSSDATTNPSPFNVISSNSGGKFYLKDTYDFPRFFSNELKDNGAPLGHDYINESSEMEIIQAATKIEIINVVYDIDNAEVQDAPPTIALSTAVRNDSDINANQTLTYTYEKWAVGTWNNSLGPEIGTTATLNVGVPFVANSKFEVSISGSGLHEWAAEEGTKQTVTSSTTITVPPKKQANATIIVRNAQLKVEFTFTQRILWANGENEDLEKTGIYSNVDSWHVDVVLDNWEDI